MLQSCNRLARPVKPRITLAMIHDKLADALEGLPPDAPFLGLDLGSKTIGVAVSDVTRTIASPVETIARRKFTLDAARLLADRISGAPDAAVDAFAFHFTTPPMDSTGHRDRHPRARPRRLRLAARDSVA